MSKRSRVADVVVLVALAGILANVAVPAARDASVSAAARDAVEEISDIRELVRAYADREGRYPAHGAWGRMPVELESEGKRVDFTVPHADLRWRNWGLHGGLDYPLLAVQVRSDEPRMLEGVMDQWPGRVILRRNDQITLVID